MGDVVDPTLRKRTFRVEMGSAAPLADFEGPFLCSRPEPSLGDEVACLFTENVFGRHDEPWEPTEIKTLRPATRERVLASLRKTWRL